MSDSSSEHTEKWALGLAAHGIKIGLFSFNRARYPWYEGIENIELLFESNQHVSGSALFEKIKYLNYLKPLRKKIKEFNPDIVHAHYATSYGLLAILSRFKVVGVSVWGSDVYDFPKQNFLFKRLLEYIFTKATFICSTSYCMKNEALNYTNKSIIVTPFGIDVEKFNRQDNDLPFSNSNEITIGNIKALETKYGAEILIKSFYEVVNHFPEKNFKLYLIGDGSQKENYVRLCSNLGISDHVIFISRIAHSEIAKWHKKIDIFVSLSILDSESFGVSLVEAMASKSCVIATSVAGFKEVLGEDDTLGKIVTKNSVLEASQALIDIIDNPTLALQKVEKARERVVNLYNWKYNVKQMIDVYRQFYK